jgi:carbon-monoxide dehydrogenase large subunit
VAKFGIGQPAARGEDDRFLSGRGRYIDDLTFPRQAYAYVLRSPHAHARIERLATEAASALTGVLAVFTGADYRAAGYRPIPCAAKIDNADGTPCADPPRWPLAIDRVRHVGDGVAMIVAETADLARDGAERVEVVYAPLVWDEVPANLAFHWETGDGAATDGAFAAAKHTVGLDLVNSRIVANPMETRGAVAVFADGRYTFHVGGQGVHGIRDMLCDDILGLPRDEMRVVIPDVGGGFGTKYFVYPEYALLLWAARTVGRPVKWIAERGEGFLSDAQARDHATHGEIALGEDGRILGLRVRKIANMGAYLSNYAPFIPTEGGAPLLPSVYAIPAVHVEVRGAFTNTVPVDAYRGAGQPEAIYAVERLIEAAARELGVSAAEIRRRNYIAPQAMPYRTALGLTYDSGDFADNMDAALRTAEFSGFSERRVAARAKGWLLGFGIASYIEVTEGTSNGDATLEVSGAGQVTILSGWQSTGQGHETTFAQVVAAHLGVPFEAVTVVQGDSDRIANGLGTGGSRSMVFAAAALQDASAKVIERGEAIAAELLEAAAVDIDYGEGAFRIAGTDRQVGLFEVAAEAERRGDEGLRVAGAFVPDRSGAYPNAGSSFPNGCHACELAIDTETGRVEIRRYAAVDDFGTVVNPMLVAGQVHGGTAQGIGQALCEHTIYDRDGQLLTGSLMDYCLPRADDLPPFSLVLNGVPSPSNPLGIKGCGESGAIVGPAAVINAALDALAVIGVTDIDMPLTPERVWRAIRTADN